MATLKETLVQGRGQVFGAFSEFQRSAIYIAPSGSYDPSTGSVSDPAGISVTGFALPYEQRSVEASGGRIRLDDVQYLIADPGVIPAAGGRVESLDGADYSIVNASDLGSDSIIWELQLRRAGG